VHEPPRSVRSVGLGTAPSSSPPVGPWAPVISVKMVPVLVGGNMLEHHARKLALDRRPERS
jgi:hypothetical protein